MSKENDTMALYKYFGFQGGTKHQLDKETGLDVFSLETYKPKSVALDSKYSEGYFCARTCGVHMRRKIGEKNKGLPDFWKGAIQGILADF